MDSLVHLSRDCRGGSGTLAFLCTLGIHSWWSTYTQFGGCESVDIDSGQDDGSVRHYSGSLNLQSAFSNLGGDSLLTSGASLWCMSLGALFWAWRLVINGRTRTVSWVGAQTIMWEPKVWIKVLVWRKMLMWCDAVQIDWQFQSSLTCHIATTLRQSVFSYCWSPHWHSNNGHGPPYRWPMLGGLWHQVDAQCCCDVTQY
jgi:hypothetical protein